MYLKSIEMQGFKSFPDKTKLTFERGTTIIVGPNGSGKSNISDAMRWVLGEISSKSLRGTKMEDIIFGGSDSRRPMGFAEVSVTFDNTGEENRLECPYDEVTVTRRYYRAGESEYYINRNACRLRDVYELFMNTGAGRDGYSIIGQGKIAEIISRKSDERRSVFEDASGIAKYRHRKTETERKLQTTEENMTRVTDIFREVEAQVVPLEKEAERAKKALELQETKKRVDVQLWLYDSERLRTEAEQAEENYRNTGYDLKLAESAIEDYNTQSTRLFEDMQQNSAAAADLLDKINALTSENHDRDSQYQVAQTNIVNANERIEASRTVITNRRERLSAEQQEGARRRAERETLAARLAELEAAHTQKAEAAQQLANRALALAGNVATALADIEEREAEAVDIRVRMQVLENGKKSDSDKNEAMTAEIAAYKKTSETLAADLAAKEKAAAAYDKDIASATATVEKADDRLAALAAKLEGIRAEENECTLQIDLARQRMEAFRAMEEHFEGYANSVRYIMEAYAAGRVTDKKGNPCGTIYGPLSKVISVEPQYVTAIEVALGNNLQHIVVEDDDVAKAAIYTLKQAEAGRATFFPISSMRGLTPTEEMQTGATCEGYIGVATELVQCDDRFAEIVSALLGRTLIFDTLDHAADMARKTLYRVKVVTLDGQVINAGGSYTGGSVKQKGGILSRAGEIASLGEQLKELTAAAETHQKHRAALEKEIAELGEAREDADNRRALLTALQGSEASEAASVRAKLDANESLVAKMNADFEALLRQRAGYDEELQKLAAREKELRREIKEIGELRAEKDVERNGLLDEKSGLEEQMTTLFIEINGVRKDMGTVEVYIAESDARAAAVAEEIGAEEQKIAGYEDYIKQETARIEANRNTYAEGEKVLGELTARHKKLTAGNMDLERRRAEINAKLQKKSAEKEIAFRAHTKNEARLTSLREELDALNGRFWEDYEMTRNDAAALGYAPLTAAGREEAIALQKNCNNRIRAMGPVDLDAVNKYKEVKIRYDAMAAQIADMTAARDDLQKIIRDLESEMRTSFVETFNKINENFNRTFAELFGGGSAEVLLTDPDNVLESGIEIKAAPPGKIIKNLVQLSGGEQSFVAIALFFAILQVNPTPFFILDEIEAALDEVNVARFAAYIKRYSAETQFILITHRRGTMEAAERLYGVTMPEHGISKVLALDVRAIAEKKEGEDWDGIFSEVT